MGGKVIRDPIHGNIQLDSLFVELSDSKYMQRLRNIKQNGLCYLVYPAMNSTRFEHSLGVYHLGGVLCRHLHLPEGDSMELQAACLLHDVGHGPFSHTFDTLMEAHGLDHETQSTLIILKSEVADILKANGISPQRVAELVQGEGRLGKLLSSEVDVDKMDYLVRDSYYAGVAYGVTDVERLLFNLSLERGDIVVEMGGLEAVESLLINRNMMYQTVYRHHTKRIAESMINHAMGCLVDDGASISGLFMMDDIDLVHMLRASTGYVKDMMSRLDERRLLKTVFSEQITSLTEDSQEELSAKASDFEARIASDFGIDEGYLMVDYPEMSMSEYRVKVKTQSGLKSIGEVSPLAKSLESSEKEKLTVNVYARGEDRRKFADFKPGDYFRYRQTRLSGYM